MCIEAQPKSIDVPNSPSSPLGALTEFNIKCECSDGFEGNFCETPLTPVNPCNSNPCAGAKLSVKSDGGSPISAGDCSASTDLTSYTCSCLTGIKGNTVDSTTECETDVDHCASSPCKNSAPCDDTSTSQGRNPSSLKTYTCDCVDTGYGGVNCDIIVDECDPNPCKNNGDCTDKINSFECTCKPGFEGLTCDNSINECGSNPCGAYVLPLTDSKCPGNSDPNDSCCIDLNNKYECVCKKGSRSSDLRFTNPSKSDKCDFDVQECSSNPCKHGTCGEDNLGDKLDFFKCTCEAGWTGEFCHKGIDWCDEAEGDDICGESSGAGTCVNGVSEYTCDCANGFNGDNCENDIDECASSPCWPYARCRQSGSRNWYPELLRLNVQPMKGADGSHLRAGLSQSDPHTASGGYYICSNCRKGFTSKNFPAVSKSKNCELDYDECLSNPCKHGACIDSQAWTIYYPQFEEFIKTKYSPAMFEEFKKSGHRVYDFYYWINWKLHDGEDVLPDNGIGLTSPDWNGVTKNNVNFWDNFQCECDPGFTGTLCDVDVNECASNPCQMGICEDLEGEFNCKCHPGIEKDTQGFCTIDIDECQSSPCTTGRGECKKSLIMTQTNFYECACLKGFNGINCENDVNECSSSPCGNKGECQDLTGEFKCDCYFGFTGVSCEIELDFCDSSPCAEFGTCSKTSPGIYKCSCPFGADSSDSTISRNLKCDVDIDECLSNPCQNGATCENVQNQLDLFQCTCVMGWTGFKTWLKTSMYFRKILFHLMPATRRVFSDPFRFFPFCKLDKTIVIKILYNQPGIHLFD